MILSVIRKSRFVKAISVLLSLLFFIDILHPQRLLALTGGPSQPEVESFSPVSTNEYVDLFTGDFKYNIPLMTVPGSNGGYPINLIYNAGPGMEQEASWVGLGWNLNTGCITRQVRGIPDDFNGENVTKTYNKKANRTYGINTAANLELLGLDVAKDLGLGLSYSQEIYYNNYKGLGLNTGLGLSITDQNSFGSSLAADVGLNFDSQGGITPSLGFGLSDEKDQISGKCGFSYNSRQGVFSMNNTLSSPKNSVSKSAGMSFGTATYVPPVNMPMTGGSARISLKAGAETESVFFNGSVGVSYSEQTLKEHVREVPAYGLMFADQASHDALKDFNREKDITVNKNSKNLPIPIMTQDVFNVSGEGMNGAFRLFRSDMGYFSDNNMSQNFDGAQIGVDLGVGAGVHAGANIEINLANSYSGCWQDGYNASDIGFTSVPNGTMAKNLYEPFYFKMLGEQTSDDPSSYLDYCLKTSPVQFTEFNGSDKNPQIDKWVHCGSTQKALDHTTSTERKKREQMIEYYTVSEAANLYPNVFTNNYTVQGDQLGAFALVKTDGTRYLYANPVYNTDQKDVMFSVSGSNHNINDKVTTYDINNDPTIYNEEGLDHTYTCTETPAYAYAYYLSCITSPDYVDVDNNGPSDNDLGFWVKFNYTPPINDYQWRVPFKDALYSRNYESDESDDKASYTYGKKQLVYINTVETNTHIATFYLIPRDDAWGANNENNTGAMSVQQMKLDKIVLCSKNDQSHPIKTVHFQYAKTGNELCQGVDNNHASNGGKLTLQSVYFTYGSDNERGRFSPYEFTYNYNPQYSACNMDRWGNYNPDCSAVNPYVPQKNGDIDVDNWAGAWCLNEITLPSGGKINVVYEADDYAYVQNRPAEQMVKIAGIGVPGNDKFTGLNPVSDNRKICFERNIPDDEGNIKYYINNLRDNLVYFKVFTKIDEGKYDYVQGYGEADTTFGNYGKCPSDTNYAFITLKPPSDKPNFNPIRYAAWQYLKLNRPDILYHNTPNDGALLQIVNIIISFVTDLGSMIMGYYNYCVATGKCNEIIVSDKAYTGVQADYKNFYPSYLRLNTPDMIKKGGGHRVKSISVNDDWIKDKQNKNEYKQEFKYRINENGREISSGVAENEPMIGGDENTLHYPIRYSSENSFNNDKALYVEEPFDENYYPGPSVGYRKVIVTSTTPTDVDKAGGAVQVTEFYTAKDFPITYNYTSVDNNAKHKPFPIQIPFIGYKTYSTQGYTQGYEVELNDMHGKMKSQATYRHGENVLIGNPIPITKTDYIYNTVNTYNPNSANVLNSQVKVVDKYGHFSEKLLGETHDFYADLRENYTHTEAYGILFNCDLLTFIPIPTLIPDIENTDQTFRTAVTNKVIYRTGILMETHTFKDGATRILKNLLFDAETGKAVQTCENNDFNKPVYNTTYPAYWYYEGMGPAYQNYRACNDGISPSPFIAGDYILAGATKYVFSNNDFFDINNGTYNYNQEPIIQSGRTNQQGLTAGSLVSLTDPFSNTYFPLFDAFNQHIWIYNNSGNTVVVFAVTDCSGKIDTVTACQSPGQNNTIEIDFCKGHATNAISDCKGDRCRCTAYIANALINNMSNNFSDIILNKDLLNDVTVHDGALTNNCTWSDYSHCFRSCLDDVLNAKATDYSSVWSYDYNDAWKDQNALLNMNDYFLKRQGCWRPLRSNVFYVERKQSGATPAGSEINIDGTYKYFYAFTWPNVINSVEPFPWVWTSQITKYSPMGYELENVNPLWIYSCALYGYNNTLATAVGNNSHYYEMAFDGFEDYADNNFPHGHMTYTGNFSDPFMNHIVTDQAHTGNKSFRLKGNPSQYINVDIPLIDPANPYSPNQLSLIKNNNYLLGLWYYYKSKSAFTIIINGVAINFTPSDPIDGWKRLEIPFNAVPYSGNTLSIKFVFSSASNYAYVYLDDIRIQPFKSTMKSYVYDPDRQLLVAELDENNYATFYNYDEENTLVQIKKETVKGIMTIKSFRQNYTKRY